MKNASETISDRELRFYRKLRKNRVFNELMAYYASLAESQGLRKAHLAKRLGKDPSQITRWFAEPGNLNLDTLSDLLTSMDAEMSFRIVPAENSDNRDVEIQPRSMASVHRISERRLQTGTSSASFEMRSERVDQANAG